MSTFRQRARASQGGSEVGASPDVGLDLFCIGVLVCLCVVGVFVCCWCVGCVGVLAVKCEFE